jgi:hypothetical protein
VASTLFDTNRVEPHLRATKSNSVLTIPGNHFSHSDFTVLSEPNHSDSIDPWSVVQHCIQAYEHGLLIRFLSEDQNIFDGRDNVFDDLRPKPAGA